MKVVIIGLGGTGEIVAMYSLMYLNYSYRSNTQVRVFLVDGDTHEEANKERQTFDIVGEYKASNNYRRFSKQNENPEVSCNYICEYVTQKNVSDIIQENDIVLLCVDNHGSRKLVNDHCSNLQNIILISGGNESIDGSVTLFIKEEGIKITPSLSEYHPEISNAEQWQPQNNNLFGHDVHINEQSCMAQRSARPQTIFSNLFSATMMLCMFYKVLNEDISSINVSDVYFDCTRLTSLPKHYKPK